MKKIKRQTKIKNQKAFTLIEMLGGLVILGLILIIVIPSLSRMIRGNDEQEIDSYYDLVEEAALVYSGKITDELGGTKNSGCKDVTLDELKKEGYLSNFNDKCTTENKIRIRNQQGKITVSFVLNCTNEEGETRSKGTSDTDACNTYKEIEEINLKDKLESDASITKTTPTGSRFTYITGTEPNNYIWYSGKLWRAIGYDTINGHVKVVTADSITSIYYSHDGTKYYPNSDVNTWVNNEFYYSLKNPGQFLVGNYWYYTSSQYVQSRVGILSETEYNYIKSWYVEDGKYTWLTNGNIVKGTVLSTELPTTIIGVRPVVTFSTDLLVQSGSGMESDPYIIDNTTNDFGKAGELINTRYSGEYVKLGGKLYRIVSVSTDGYTKLIGTETEGNYVFSDESGGYTYDFTVSNIKANLLETSGNWYNKLSTAEQNFISDKGQFCLDTINGGTPSYLSSRCLTEGRLRTLKVGLPKIGDLFTSYVDGLNDEYWTINPNTETDADGNQYNSRINTITKAGTVSNAAITESKATVIVFYLDSNVKIKSGNGMKNTPYELQ